MPASGADQRALGHFRSALFNAMATAGIGSDSLRYPGDRGEIPDATVSDWKLGKCLPRDAATVVQIERDLREINGTACREGELVNAWSDERTERRKRKRPSTNKSSGDLEETPPPNFEEVTPEMLRRDFVKASSSFIATLIATRFTPVVASRLPEVDAGRLHSVQGLQDAVGAFRDLYQSVPTHKLLPSVLGLHEIADGVIRAGRGSTLESALSVFAEASQLLGRVYYDRGQYEEAHRYHAIATASAEEAENPNLVAYSLGCLASISTENLIPQYALDILSSDPCRFAARRSTATTRAWLGALEAEAAAWVGDEKRAMSTLEQAKEWLERSDPQEDPPWMVFFDEPRLLAYDGFCHLQLQRPQAETKLKTAADSLLPVYAKRRSGVLCNLSRHYAIQSEIEEASRSLLRAAALVHRTQSVICLRRVREIRSELRHVEHSDVLAEVDELLRSTG